MSNQNKIFQHVVKLFNYKTYILGKGYFTANLINVYERYYELYKNHSEVAKMDIWSQILAKWYNSILVRSRKNIERIKAGKVVFKCPDLYKYEYEHFINDLKFLIRERIYPDPCEYQKETNYDTLKYLHDAYISFIRSINYVIRESYHKIEYRETQKNKPLSWYESKEIIPGHYSSITKLNPKNRQYYRYHPA